MKTLALMLALVAAACLTGGPAAAQGPEKAAIAAAEAWLALVDAGAYGASWDTAAALFKRAVTRAQWTRSVTAVRPPLGDLLSRRVASAKVLTSLPGAPDGTYVVIQFAAAFSQKRSAMETVTPMLDPDGTWRVSGYYIN
jgi:hypothetical protein